MIENRAAVMITLLHYILTVDAVKRSMGRLCRTEIDWLLNTITDVLIKFSI